MAFSFLDKKSVYDAYHDSKTFMLPLFQPFDEFERIAKNKPHPGIDSAYPKVTDGTTASIIQKTPKRIVQQIPTGLVKSDSDDWLTIVANFIFTNRIIPNANYQFQFLQKNWAAIGKGLTFGSCPGYVPFLNRGDYFGTDLTIPYIKDVFLEPGKLSDKDSNFIFLRAWYQPRDIDAIINKERKLSDNAKERKEAYESGWDLKALADIKDELSTDMEASSSSTRDKQKGKNGVEIIHAFQRGNGSEFYSFHAPTGKVVRTKKNRDPRGQIPIHYFYADTDLSNPLGKGYVELVGAMQNLLDSEVQMYQFNRALQLGPPLVKRGTFSKSQIKLVPNQIMDLGTDPNNTLELLKLDTSALNNFPANYGLMKSQLINLLSSPDTSISSEIGNPGFSKTHAGVQQQQNNVSIDDNYIRKQYESWFEDVAETMINLYFAERKGTDEIQLDDNAANKLRALSDFDQDKLSKDNKIRLNYSDETEKLKFEVDASTSNLKDDAAERDRLVELLDLTMKYPPLQQILNVQELTDRIVVKSGVEDPEKIVPKPKKEEGADGQPVPQEPPQLTPEMVQQMIAEQLGEALKTSDMGIKQGQLELKGRELDMKERQMESELHLKADNQAHAQTMAEEQFAAQNTPPLQPTDMLDPEDQEYLEQLQGFGLSPEQASQALAMLHHGMPPEQVLETFMNVNGEANG